MIDKRKAARLKRWRETVTSFKIISGQQDLCSIFKNRTGGPVSQSFISYMESGVSAIQDRQIYTLTSYFPFTTADHFISGDSAIIDIKLLLRWILEKHNVTMTEFSHMIGDDYYDQAMISQMNPAHGSESWQNVFDVINEKFNYNISAEKILSLSPIEKEFTGKNKETERFLEVIVYLIDVGYFLSWRDAASKLGCSPQLLSNMKDPKKKQAVTMTLACSLANTVPRVNTRWLLTGKESMILPADSALNL